jgi:hypothetical protein
MYQPFVKIWLGGLVVPGHAKHDLEISGLMLCIAPE